MFCGGLKEEATAAGEENDEEKGRMSDLVPVSTPRSSLVQCDSGQSKM